MDKVKKAWAKVADVDRRGGIAGHDSPHNGERPCSHCADLRELMLAVHYEVCEWTFDLKNTGGYRCGTDGGYCERAKALKELEKEA